MSPNKPSLQHPNRFGVVGCLEHCRPSTTWVGSTTELNVSPFGSASTNTEATQILHKRAEANSEQLSVCHLAAFGQRLHGSHFILMRKMELCNCLAVIPLGTVCATVRATQLFILIVSFLLTLLSFHPQQLEVLWTCQAFCKHPRLLRFAGPFAHRVRRLCKTEVVLLLFCRFSPPLRH